MPSGITLIYPGEAPRSVIPQTTIHIIWLQPACSATSQHFHLPPCYESHEIAINISMNTANLNIINMSAREFRIQQHLEDHWNRTLLHHLVNIPSGPIDKLYKQMVNGNGPINPFMSIDESIGETVSVCTLFSHAGIYVMAIGSLIPTGLGIICGYFFCCWPARLVCRPLQSSSTQYTIVYDNVEEAPTYRCNGKAWWPIVRPCENHALCMEWKPTQTESQQKQQIQCKAIPASGSLDTTKIQEHDKNIWSVVRLRFRHVATPLNILMNLLWTTIAASHITRCTTDTHLDTITLSPLKMHSHMAWPTDQWTCATYFWLKPSSIISTHSHCYLQLSI